MPEPPGFCYFCFLVGPAAAAGAGRALGFGSGVARSAASAAPPTSTSAAATRERRGPVFLAGGGLGVGSGRVCSSSRHRDEVEVKGHQPILAGPKSSRASAAGVDGPGGPGENSSDQLISVSRAGPHARDPGGPAQPQRGASTPSSVRCCRAAPRPGACRQDSSVAPALPAAASRQQRCCTHRLLLSRRHCHSGGLLRLHHSRGRLHGGGLLGSRAALGFGLSRHHRLSSWGGHLHRHGGGGGGVDGHGGGGHRRGHLQEEGAARQVGG